MKLADIVHSKEYVLNNEDAIENDMIMGNDIKIIGHFGNIVSLIIWTSSVCIISGYNNTGNLGLIIKAIVELLGVDDEDGYCFSKLKNVPCRIIVRDNKCVGFGHFMKDKFVYVNDLAKITE